MLMGHLEPTRANRTILSCHFIFMGCYMVLSTAGYRRMSYVALARYLLFGVAVLQFVVVLRSGSIGLIEPLLDFAVLT